MSNKTKIYALTVGIITGCASYLASLAFDSLFDRIPLHRQESKMENALFENELHLSNGVPYAELAKQNYTIPEDSELRKNISGWLEKRADLNDKIGVLVNSNAYKKEENYILISQKLVPVVMGVSATTVFPIISNVHRRRKINKLREK